MAGATRKPAADLSALFDVFVLSQAVHQLLADALADAPLTPEEYAVYSAVLAEPGCTPTALARALAAPPATVSDWVRTMTRRGHVVRETRPDDRRSYGISLTAAGLDAHRQANRGFEAANLAFVSLLPHGEAALRRTLTETAAAARTARDRLAESVQGSAS